MPASVANVFRLVTLLGLFGCGAGVSASSTATDGGSSDAAPLPVSDGAASEPEGASGPGDASDAGETYPAPHPALPQVVDLGGPVLTHPRIVPVFYEGDALMATLEQDLNALATTPYWTAATAEYGVGALTVGPTVVVPGSAPDAISDAEIVAWIAAGVDGSDAGAADGGAAWPTPDGNTIYTIFFPSSTTITLLGATSCVGFGGYHGEAAYAGGKTPYAVIPRCGGHTLDELTFATSHELAEASTDPFPETAPAYSATEFAGSGWSMLGGAGELGDMCEFDPSSQIAPPALGFAVQRIWSNAAAAAGHDPCAPAPVGEVYFNSIPELATVQVARGYYVAGVPGIPGASTTVALHLFSDGPTSAPWTLAAAEVQQSELPPDPQSQLSFSFDTNEGRNGDVVHLTITRAPLPDGGTPTGLPFQITSSLGSQSHSYFGMVGF